jgi:hypothetical protein
MRTLPLRLSKFKRGNRICLGWPIWAGFDYAPCMRIACALHARSHGPPTEFPLEISSCGIRALFFRATVVWFLLLYYAQYLRGDLRPSFAAQDNTSTTTTAAATATPPPPPLSPLSRGPQLKWQMFRLNLFLNAIVVIERILLPNLLLCKAGDCGGRHGSPILPVLRVESRFNESVPQLHVTLPLAKTGSAGNPRRCARRKRHATRSSKQLSKEAERNAGLLPNCITIQRQHCLLE